MNGLHAVLVASSGSGSNLINDVLGRLRPEGVPPSRSASRSR
jgi:hypothetical protein